MILRAEWGWQRWYATLSPAKPPERAQGFGKMVMRGLTAVYVLWLAYRLMVQPAWLAQLPEMLRELQTLAELAGGLTLVLVWGALWWRSQANPTPPEHVPALLVDDLYALSPREFEQYVAKLFRRRGYRVKVRGRSGDLGVDLEVVNRVGRKAVVQCKRYTNTVGPDIVRELFGTMIHERAVHGFLVTTADISDSARDWARGKPMTLIAGDRLVEIAAALGDRVPRAPK